MSEARASVLVSLSAERAIAEDAALPERALGDTLQLARRFKLWSYDAAYLELALRASQPLVTLDADLQSAVQQVGGTVA